MSSVDWEKYERQMFLLAALCDAGRPVRLQEIRDTVPGYGGSPEASRKRFIRDKDELVLLGVPIETIAGDSPEETGYRVDRTAYELPTLHLDREELAALHLALQTISIGVEDGQVDRVLWRLGGIVESDRSSETIDRVLGGLCELPAPPDLLRLVRAAADQRVVTFDYETGTGDYGLRTVEPWYVGFERGRWYLHGFDQDRDDARNFRFDRMRGVVEVTGRAARAERPVDRAGTADPWEYGEGESTVVELWLDETASALAAPSLSSCSSRSVADGTVWAVPVTNWPAFRSFVLSFLDRAEILEPPSMRTAMAEWLSEMAAAGASD